MNTFTPVSSITPRPQLVAWEITRSCNLYCAHCRAAAHSGGYEGELSTDECFKLIDQIAEVGKPILILTGGEPLLRPDVFDIGKYAVGKGFRVVMGTNGTMVTESIATQIKAVPLSRISVSLDFPTPELQDKFRGAKGAFELALAGIKNAQAAGVEVQINMTVTQKNAEYLPELVDLALDLGVAAFHPFMLVPTGRGKGLAQEELSPEDYESTLKWIYQKQLELGERLNFKPTDAPHYYRIVQQCGGTVSFGHGHQGGHGQTAGAAPRHERPHPRLPGRHRFLLHLPYRTGSGLRIPGHRGRKYPAEHLRRGLGKLAAVPRDPRPVQTQGQMRPLRIQDGLRRLPRPGL